MSRTAIRCAIYTRKSSDEGLEQGFNSLDAQHEACAAYVASQRHEGWKLVRARYDDGGLSGGTLERPGLQRLLADIDAGRIDMVVVYKIDRLTRSLADFAKLVERLEAAGCSFVSVTQAFNTSSSMGRLTLNVLLSFAQFEREVTAERIRDKIAASKKKGLWMGGLAPLGYDPHPDPQMRQLVISATEAETVLSLFTLYDRLGCLNAVAAEADRLGLRSKRRCFASGRTSGGGRLSRGQIYHLLRNPVYLGRIRHKDRDWPGTHQPIVEEDLWARVQDKLQAASRRRRGGGSKSDGSVRAAGRATAAPLIGKLRDETGDLLTPTHTQRRGRWHRYYVSNRLISGGTDPSGWRLPAPDLEKAIAQIMSRHIADAARRHALLAQTEASTIGPIQARALDLAKTLRESDPAFACDLLQQANLAPGQIVIQFSAPALADALGADLSDLAQALLSLEAPFTCRRRGVEMRIIAAEPRPEPDATLVRALRNAHRWADALRSGTPLARVATDAGYSERYVARVIPLATLSPRIQSSIVDGRQPVELTLKKILRMTLPLDWPSQEKILGLAN